MGRLHVPETRADPTIAEMGLREGGYGGWGSELSRFGLLSRVTSSGPFAPFVSQDGDGKQSLGEVVAKTKAPVSGMEVRCT
jgi:hypothetical protein